MSTRYIEELRVLQGAFLDEITASLETDAKARETWPNYESKLRGNSVTSNS
jgi:hypothetical protein